jgi:outer membrane protein OmpA-like peptidoglycan-associated protein
MKKISVYILLSVFTTTIFAQQKDTPFEKEFFKDRKDEYKEAKGEFEKGLKLYELGIYKFPEAIPFLEKAYDFNQNYSVLNYMLGNCYLASIHKQKALPHFLKAYELNPNVDADINFKIGFAYHLKYDWENAVKHYEFYKKALNTKSQLSEIEFVMKKIEECKTGKTLMARPERVWIDNLGGTINNQYPEYSPFISADEYTIVYTARRTDTKGGKVDDHPEYGDNMFFEDIYVARRDETTGKWQTPENLVNINSENHDATAGLSPDGNRMFVYYGDKGGGDIYESFFKDGKWSKPEKLNKNINTEHHETSATISFDGKQLYFISDRPGGIGNPNNDEELKNHDIWVSNWDEKKKDWGTAINLGPTINTKYEERSCYFHPDGVTMYLSSDGHATMGGLDVFQAKLEGDKWTAPVNLGYPINTPDDEVHFVVSGSGRYGYYASFRPEGKGEKDLYRITFLGPEKLPMTNSEDNLIASLANPVKEIVIEPKVEIKTSNLAILKGIIRDAKTLKPLEAKLELINNETNTLVASFTSDPTTGKYMVTIPSGANYGIAVKADGYLFHSENINLPASSGYKEYEKNIDLKQVEVGATIALKNIFYDFDKATLRPESANELERLTKMLTDNPTVKIELGSHTDSQGSNDYNQKLSEARAKSVMDYLIGKGISPDRLTSKGYGETKLLVTDAQIAAMKTKTEKEAGHQENRRTEFKITSK